MRALPLLAVILLSACSADIGPMRRRPGANVVLPAHISVKEVVLKEAACFVAQSRDTTSRVGATPAAKDPLRAACGATRAITPPTAAGAPPP